MTTGLRSSLAKGVCGLLLTSKPLESFCDTMVRLWDLDPSQSCTLEISIQLTPTKQNSKKISVGWTLRGRNRQPHSRTFINLDHSNGLITVSDHSRKKSLGVGSAKRKPKSIANSSSPDTLTIPMLQERKTPETPTR